jgi:predicted alpha/beta hydrolase
MRTRIAKKLRSAAAGIGLGRPRSESIEVRTADGVALRATLQEPRRARGTAVLLHGMFARRAAFDAGLADALGSAGWRTVALDFRGHGESGKAASAGGQWTYDDLVEHDLPAVTSSARARWKGPLVVVGHSLGGHVALAAHGAGVIDCDAICTVTSNVWLPQFEPSRLRWQAKRAAGEFIAAMVRARGYFPARQMRLGTDDESAGTMNALVRAIRTGRWCSEDEGRDYERGLSSIRIPVMAVATTKGRLDCVPECVERMLARCGGTKDFRLVARDDDDGPAPDPMGLITGPKSKHVWRTISDFIERTRS